MPIYQEYSGINKFVNKKLDKLISTRTEEFVNRYAMQPDGEFNQPLAERIRFEVSRRGDMSRELDIYEPVRWAGISALLGFMAGSMVKYALGDRNIEKIAITGAATGIAGLLVQLVRPYLRFEAALYASAQTAIGSYERNDPVTKVMTIPEAQIPQLQSQQPDLYASDIQHNGTCNDERARNITSSSRL